MDKPHASQEDSRSTSADAVEQVERTAILLGQEAKQLVSDRTAKMPQLCTRFSTPQGAKIASHGETQFKRISVMVRFNFETQEEMNDKQ